MRRRYGVRNKAGLEVGGAVGAEHRREPRLGKARHRRLGEDCDRHTFKIAEGHSRRIAPARWGSRRENTPIAATT